MLRVMPLFLIKTKLMELRSERKCVKSFSFDSRKNEILTEVKTEDGKHHPRYVNQRQIVILRTPYSYYLRYCEAKDNSMSPEIASHKYNRFLSGEKFKFMLFI